MQRGRREDVPAAGEDDLHHQLSRPPTRPAGVRYVAPVERVTPEQLAQTITQVTRRAAMDVRDQVNARMAALTSEEGVLDVVPGAPSIKDIFRVEQREEPAAPLPPSDEDFGSSVLRKKSRPVQRAAGTDEDDDFGGNSIMGRGNSW
ncbi:hypothetical protein GCM10017774_26690 [Lentzea cavernae]|uniref:Uncharacterized protein n=1 Tax=Lentzea cavernae TaxID=2020703 RepID=A0ABQ3MD89_9PSEU|nr:hypothetical protein GCM10017774_26690 [Lentzea cavernae]